MNARSRLTISHAHSAGTLSEAERAEMFALYERYYDAASYGLFCADLAGKDHLLLLRDEAGILQGFSTLALYEREFEGQPVRVIFSGDTIVDESQWGQQRLAFAWIRLAGELKAAAPDVPLYWFLISKGHRTYRYLSAFSREYFPAPGRETPPHSRALMDFLARDRFGVAYDTAQGVIRFTESRGHLRTPYAAIPGQHLRLPEVAYFLARNPGYARGDELVCLCELTAGNLQPIARRAFLGPGGRSAIRDATHACQVSGALVDAR